MWSLLGCQVWNPWPLLGKCESNFAFSNARWSRKLKLVIKNLGLSLRMIYRSELICGMAGHQLDIRKFVAHFCVSPLDEMITSVGQLISLTVMLCAACHGYFWMVTATASQLSQHIRISISADESLQPHLRWYTHRTLLALESRTWIFLCVGLQDWLKAWHCPTCKHILTIVAQNGSSCFAFYRLYGISVAQAYVYMQNCRNDPKWMKAIAVLIM